MSNVRSQLSSSVTQHNARGVPIIRTMYCSIYSVGWNLRCKCRLKLADHSGYFTPTNVCNNVKNTFKHVKSCRNITPICLNDKASDKKIKQKKSPCSQLLYGSMWLLGRFSGLGSILHATMPSNPSDVLTHIPMIPKMLNQFLNKTTM